MSDIIATVSSTESTTVVVDSSESTTSVSQVGIQGTSAAEIPLSSNTEVDVATNGKENGSVLVYRTTTNKWTATTTLDAQNMEGGHY